MPLQEPAAPVASPYNAENALDDLPAIKYAAALFLDSRMVESEEYCLKVDPHRERLYITAGYSLIQCLKALMSFENDDLKAAACQVRHGNSVAIAHRSPPPPIFSRLTNLLWENEDVTIGHYKTMTDVQRHAELLYAETTFAKALLGVVTSRNWLSFLTEALSFRTMINTYLALGKFLDAIDEDPEPPVALDADFRSGVLLGVGASHLLLSLMPSRLLSVAEIFGYSGNRQYGLELLMKVGGWKRGADEPAIGTGSEGLRRSLADICLLCFHLVMSTVLADGKLNEDNNCNNGSQAHAGVDIRMAERILEWNLKRYPNGVFFHFAAGRLCMIRSSPREAIECFEFANKVATAGGEAVLAATSAITSKDSNNTGTVNVSQQPAGVPDPSLSEQEDPNKTTPDTLIEFSDPDRASQKEKEKLDGKGTKKEFAYRGLRYLALWEGALAALSAWDIAKASHNFKALVNEGATWSPACYAYGAGACLLQMCNIADNTSLFGSNAGSGSTSAATSGLGLGGSPLTSLAPESALEQEERRMEATRLIASTPSLVQKIAGKSIPIEKFVARKARKFIAQGYRLVLPALEFSYMFQGIDHAPREVLYEEILPLLEKSIAKIEKRGDRLSLKKGTGPGMGAKKKHHFLSGLAFAGHEVEEEKVFYWDDHCLAWFLQGVCLRFIAYPDKHAKTQQGSQWRCPMSQEEAARRAINVFSLVLKHGQQIQLDHYILYHTYYELGRLYACMGQVDKARENLEIVLSGQRLESDEYARKGKYSNESILLMRAENVLNSLAA